MGRQKGQAISRKGLDSIFVEEETRKSNLVLEANLLKEQGHHQQAADRFAEAAQIEERLSEMLAEKGLTNKYFIDLGRQRVCPTVNSGPSATALAARST